VAHAEIALAIIEARNDTELQHWCEVQRMFAVPAFEEPRYGPATSVVARRNNDERARQLTHLHAQLESISSLFETVLTLVEHQGHAIGRLERNVDDIQVRIDASQDELIDAAPRAYRVHRWHNGCLPRSLSAKLRLTLITLLVLNVLFVIVAFF
jgi:t-SNARE complex subunit (syntaxin)